MMFGSLNIDGVIPRVQSRQVQRDLEPRKSIRLDVLDATNVKMPRRSSFLPENWDEDPKVQYSATKTSRYSLQGVSTVSTRTPERQKRVKRFCTGSAYYGQFNQLGMAGRGVYKFPHGVIYDGFFNSKGEFHGTGILVYPGGQRVEGLWKNGKLIKGGATLISHDNSPSSRYYCKMPDRRFQIEVQNELRPAGQEYLTNSTVPRQIPPGMYDTGEGFYDPVRRVVIDYYDSRKNKTAYDAFSEESKYAFNLVLQATLSQQEMETLMRHQPASFRHATIECIPTEEREEWIIKNCRKASDDPIGYRTDLYEIWTAGCKKNNLENMDTLSRIYTQDVDVLIERLSRLSEQKSSNVYTFIKNVNVDKGSTRSMPSTPDQFSLKGRKSKRLKGAPNPRVTGYGLKPFMFLFSESKPVTTHVRIREDQVEVV